MGRVTCTRRLEFDAGHVLMNHEGKCAHIHGHRYAVEFTCSTHDLDGVGRVVDFSVVKNLVGAWIDKHWDHAMLVNMHDDMLISFLSARKNRLFALPFNPTAERLAETLFFVASALLEGSGVFITQIRVHETPNCYADFVHDSSVVKFPEWFDDFAFDTATSDADVCSDL